LSEQTFVFEDAYKEGQTATSVKFKFVNDYGAFVEGMSDITVAP
jgi:hypothetical protein